MALVACLVTLAAAAPPVVTHIYELNGNFDDALGGPSLVAHGGAITATNYRFDPVTAGSNQGLSLRNALSDAAEYSIEMKFQIDNPVGFVKLIDFKDLTSDEGLYNQSGLLDYYNFAAGSDTVITADEEVHLVATRNGMTNKFIGYTDAVRQFAFVDTSTSAVFDATANIIQFFQDDNVTGQGEVSAGVVDYIRDFDGVLTPADIDHLADGGSPQTIPSVPEPATGGILLLALVGSGWTAVRRY